MNARPAVPQARFDQALTIVARQLAVLREGKAEASRSEQRAWARALAVTHPRSPHGQTLTRALSPKVKGRPRSAEERAAAWLAHRGEAPTGKATLERVKAERERARQAEQARAQVITDGPRAAALVAATVARTGTGPTWSELGRAMGWTRKQFGSIIPSLCRAGWLESTAEPRSLRPGMKHKAAA